LRSRCHLGAWSAVVAGLVVLVALRLVLIHVNLPISFYWEEGYRLVIGTELLNGPHLPVAEYQADHYQGGSLVIGIMAVPLFSLLGASFETLKLVPLSFTLATTVLWCILLWRALGPPTAAIDAWLLVLGPPLAQVYQVVAMGSHAESAFFTAAGFLLVCEISAGALSRFLPFLLGLVGGLGLWFCYTAASGVAAWGLIWLFFSPRGTVRRGFLPLLCGGLVGLLPWLVYNFGHDFQGLDYMAELLIEKRPVFPSLHEASSAMRLLGLFTTDLPRLFDLPREIPGVPPPAVWLAYGLAVAGFLGLAVVTSRATSEQRRGELEGRLATSERTPALLILFAVAFHVAAYVVSSFPINPEHGFHAYRFFSPLFFLATAALAIAIAHAWSRGRKFAAAGSLVLALVLGGYGTAALLLEPTSHDRAELDNGYVTLGLLNEIKYRERPQYAINLLSRLPDRPRDLAFSGFGWGLEHEYETYADWPRFVAALPRTEAQSDLKAALRGARWAVRTRLSTTREHIYRGYRVEDNRRMLRRLSVFDDLLSTLPESASISPRIRYVSLSD